MQQNVTVQDLTPCRHGLTPVEVRVACRLHSSEAEVEMLKLGYSLIAVLAACSLGAAQELEKKTQTKVSVRGWPRDHCYRVHRAKRGRWLHVDARREQGGPARQLPPRVGRRRSERPRRPSRRDQRKGSRSGEGRIKVETKNESKVGDGDRSKTTSKAEVKGDLSGLPYLGVKSVKMIARACP